MDWFYSKNIPLPSKTSRQLLSSSPVPGYFHAYIRRALALELELLLRNHPELGYGKLNTAINEAVRRFVHDVRREAAERAGEAKTTDGELPPVDEVLLLLRKAVRDERRKQAAAAKRGRVA